jgi:hypothetical protein
MDIEGAQRAERFTSSSARLRSGSLADWVLETILTFTKCEIGAVTSFNKCL